MRGIMFTKELFSLIISGEKTQTRRMSDMYKVGEILYLKEPYRLNDNGKPEYKYMNPLTDLSAKWRNKMFMPARYARYFIKIISKRQELLQSISDEDCKREGIRRITIEGFMDSYFSPHDCCDEGYNTPQEAYAALIDSINGKGTWDSNPLVTVYDFKKTLTK